MATISSSLARSPSVLAGEHNGVTGTSQSPGDIQHVPHLPSPERPLLGKNGRAGLEGAGGSVTRKPRAFATTSKYFKDPNRLVIGRSEPQAHDPPAHDETENAEASKSTAKPKRKSRIVDRLEADKAQDALLEPDAVRPKKRAATASRRKAEQARIGAAKITKPSTSATRIAIDRKETDNSPLVKASTSDHQPFVPSASVRRRRSWTPIEDSVCVIDSTDTSTVGTSQSPSCHASASNARSLFKSLNETFGYTSSPSLDSGTVSIQPLDVTRRHKVDLIPAAKAGKDAPSNVKASAVKKRPRTITEKATEQFRVTDEQTPAKPDVDSTGGVANSKAAKRKVRAKKQQNKDDAFERLLQPEEALDVWKNQDLVFGTSSQLVREDSPTTIRNVQQALRRSVSEDVANLRTEIASLDSSGSDLPGSTSLASTASKRLWTASARNNDGSLLDRDFVDLTQPCLGSSALHFSPSPKLMHKSTAKLTAATNLSLAETREPDENSEPCVRSDNAAAQTEAHGVDLPRTAVGNRESYTPAQYNAEPSGCDVMPKYGEWPENDLKAAIRAYGFKPMKSRKPMIKKLEKCWIAQRSLNAVATSPSAAARAIERRDQGQDAEKEPTSESALDPGRRTGEARVSPGKLPSPILPSGISVNQFARSGANANEPVADRAYLFTKIQEAVVSCPPTHDPSEPTWHEKILLYDPIILEDLTVWLNTKGLNRVGIDDEVATSLVRDWCESQSICCLWRFNLRGSERGGRH